MSGYELEEEGIRNKCPEGLDSCKDCPRYLDDCDGDGGEEAYINEEGEAKADLKKDYGDD